MNQPRIQKLVKEYLKNKGLSENLALTFEDVTIVDLFSDIPSRSSIEDTKARLAQNIFLNTPIMSANMDTVTESQMAIAMARSGGIGFIHQFLLPERRKREIELVKRADSGVIGHPLTATPSMTLRQAKELMEAYTISSLLVVDERTKKLVGILAHRDYHFETDETKKVGTLMKKSRLITAPPKTKLTDAKAILWKNKIEKLPLVDKSGRVKGLITTKDIDKVHMFPKAARDKRGRLLVGGTTGISSNAIEEIEEMLKSDVDVIMVDTARGNSKRLVDTIKLIRKRFGKSLPLIAGNVDTPEGTLALIDAGADSVKIGIGGGSACKTRMGPGIGMPQLTAVAESFAVAEERNIPIIADGGIKNSSDFAKALAAGASSVMIGGLFGGTEEAPGKPFYEDGEKWKIFRGSASAEFQLSRVDRDERSEFIRTPEGVPKRVKYKGEVAMVINELMGHLYSSMSYVGARSLKEFRKKAVFRQQTLAGYSEGKPHDVS